MRGVDDDRRAARPVERALLGARHRRPHPRAARRPGRAGARRGRFQDRAGPDRRGVPGAGRRPPGAQPGPAAGRPGADRPALRARVRGGRARRRAGHHGALRLGRAAGDRVHRGGRRRAAQPGRADGGRGRMGQSVAALVHGFRAYDEQLWLGGVVLNRVASPRHEAMLREALDDIGVPVYGALRRHELPPVLPARRHGLVPAIARDAEAVRAVRRLGEAVAATVDLDRLLVLARSAPALTVDPWSPEPAAGAPGGARPVVALAGGPGGSYSHPETAELLRAAGAEVVTFDPLRDEALPAGTRALVVGGGLPESYADELSANRRLCIAVAELARTGRPVLAEGAGLLWLARELDGLPMCGVLDAIGASRDGLVIGYREATARTDSVVAAAGTVVVGHKQHSAVLTPRAGERPAWSWDGGAPEGFVWRGVHASQLVPHWAAYPEIAARLVAAAAVEPATAEAPA
ncbi:cobyrinic acid a,c-diamide synthase [Micromonospora sp. ATA51]|uniref:cobyrinic acid a,c-diamide synthase n=1 Tax=Micromonospora sp. ATA51 TaxID=2806098 RepID=UPI0035C94B80